jgi:hypothetical protein
VGGGLVRPVTRKITVIDAMMPNTQFSVSNWPLLSYQGGRIRPPMLLDGTRIAEWQSGGATLTRDGGTVRESHRAGQLITPERSGNGHH